MKYRLKIPEMIKKEEAGLANDLSGFDNRILVKSQNQDSYVQFSIKGELKNWCSKIPKDWLEPIEDGPVSAEDTVKKTVEENGFPRLNIASGIGFCVTLFDLKKFATEGEKNDRKRTKPVIDAITEQLHDLDTYSNAPDSEALTKIRQALKTLQEQDK